MVKLISGANEKGGALYDLDSKYGTVFHVLSQNKARHEPREFSDILRYLVLNVDMDTAKRSSLLETNESGKIPLLLLWQSLKSEGLSDLDILKNDDFIFLTKATCYHHHYSSNTSYCALDEKGRSKTYDGRLDQIGNIPFDLSFLTCCKCFGRNFTARALSHFLSLDNTFLLEKDMFGVYPFLGIVSESEKYTMRNLNYTDFDFEQFIVKTILKIAPQCAQQRDENGRLPLHLVADVVQKPYLTDRSRTSLMGRLLVK